MNEKNMNELRKFAEENGLDADDVVAVAQRIAVCKKIEAIAFRAHRAMYTELSLIYDELSLCETPDEATDIQKEELIPVLAANKALNGTAAEAVDKIMKGEIPAAVPAFLREIKELPDDDETIAAWLIHADTEATEKVRTTLREYVEEAFKGGGNGNG